MKNKQGGGERDLLERVMHNRFFRGTALFVRRYFDHRVARDSAALTYYLLFAMFPLLIFLSNLVGFFAVDIEGFLRQLGTIIPAEVLDLLIQYLRYVSRVSSRTLMTFSLIFSIWFPMRAANALLLSVRKAYGMGRPTQFLRHQAKVFLYTICLILTILLSLVLVTVGRSVLNLCADYFHFSAILTDGFIELWSTLLASWGQKPLPYFEEPPMSPYSQPELYKEYPLVLTTGARHYESFHSEHRQMSRLRSRLPQPLFEIHPDKAAELGIEDGDWCWIESPIGRCREVAKVTPIVDPRVVQADHGWWFPEADPEDQGEGCFATYARNINVCLPSECGDTGFGNQSKCYLCKVYKCTPEEIPLPEPAQPKDRFAKGSFRNSTLEAEMED